ncbi:hypothetical protein Nwi_1495 [Nitrobacter winogradskyi Nb-255]|uniref:Uncharacterized protein n=1 Tax=Nitrobacter winogradskyi (strain ATCC 25391 / DSM 10237 / CIP 104748 / NCIMB 11846 / Nb-255) TaxID=323098 RepID=Q3SSI5_NITWN|nr:hypothetical protein [Nitrobacter winogradskyi]ABA04756.1 hypothetical protein Nwi_1495 [Nitrobacter winogradskyi Nb-255]
MTADVRLMSLLGALRNFNDYITASGRLSAESLANQIRIERILADKVMFNMGWYAAREIAGDLKGAAATEAVLPLLFKAAELANSLADATERCEALDAKLAELNRPGRKKGSYEKWHFDPGYSVVVAMIETRPEKRQSDHVRWAVKNGWLDKSIPDKTHIRRIGLIQRRQEAERAAQLASLGANVIPFKSNRNPQKRAK